MIKKEQVRVIKGLLDHLDNKTNVKAEGMIKNPADTYTSEDRFQNEYFLFIFNFEIAFCLFESFARPSCAFRI